MASKKKPGIGRIKRKKRTIKSYVGTDVAKAAEAVGIPLAVEVDAREAALSSIAARLAELVVAANILVARANEPARERQPRRTAAEKAAAENAAREASPGPHPSEVAMEKTSSAPSLDELRAAAVAYAGKHGKEALVALLRKYNPEGKISTIPEKELAPCLAGLKMGMVD